MESKTLTEARKAFKAAGYKVKVKTYSEFCGATVTAPNGDAVNGGMFTPDELAAHRAEHAAAFAVLDTFKGRTFDGGFRVIF